MPAHAPPSADAFHPIEGVAEGAYRSEPAGARPHGIARAGPHFTPGSEGPGEDAPAGGRPASGGTGERRSGGRPGEVEMGLVEDSGKGRLGRAGGAALVDAEGLAEPGDEDVLGDVQAEDA